MKAAPSSLPFHMETKPLVMAVARQRLRTPRRPFSRVIKMNGKAKRDVHRDTHQEITDHIIEAIEAGAGQFEMPWHRSGGGMPVNAKTGNLYNGVNVLSLWVAGDRRGYGSDKWATYRQWQELDANVRHKEKGSPIVFYKETTRDVVDPVTGNASEEPSYFARTSRVFNADQVEGYTAPDGDTPTRNLVKIIENADSFVANTGADIHNGGERAYYRRSSDHIQMPERERFTGTPTSTPTESYYAVLLHELTHWTGHPKRLDRDFAGRFSGQGRAMEELVAELGSAFLCADLGVSNSPRPDHAAYVANWLEVLNDDKKAIFTASARARDAVGYLSGVEKYNG